MNKVFVYGTLKKGFGNHDLLKSSKFLGEAYIRAQLYSLGGLPVAIEKSSSFVFGEVYEVTDDILDLLDRLEGHPNFYTRKEIDACTLFESMKVQCYLFPKNCEKSDLKIINSFKWTE